MEFPFVYIVIIIGLALCFVCHKSKTILYFVILYILFIAVFRDETVGTDYTHYIDLFDTVNNNNILTISVLERVEVGYLGSMLIFKTIFENPYVYYGLQYLIFFAGFWGYCRFKKTDAIWALFFFFFLGFYFKAFNGIRQMTTIGMILFCLPMLEKKKYLKFSIFTIIISLLFHSAELIYLLLIPLKFLSDRTNIVGKKILIVGLMFSYLLFFMNHSFLYNIGLFGTLGDQYNSYFAMGENREEITNLTGTIYTILALILIFISNVEKYRFELSTVVLSIIIFNITSLIHISATRLSLDFMILLCPLSSQLLLDKTTKRKWFLGISLMIISIVLFVHQFVINNSSEIKPYLFSF